MVGCNAIKSDVDCKAVMLARLPRLTRLLRFQGSQGYRLGVSRINIRTNLVVFVSN